MNDPLISIIIPTYNRAHLIGETLDSVLAQTYENWECIIVDDGSTDNSDEVIGNYIRKDARFQYYHRPEDRLKGANACRNYGFELSNGEYINWFDSDDILSNNKLQSQILLNKLEQVDLMTCKWGRFEENKDDFEIKELKIYKDFKSGVDLLEQYAITNNFYPSHVFLISRKTCVRAGLWNENLTINQDGEFFCRILIVSKNIKHSNDSYVLYRTPAVGNVSTLKNINQAYHIVSSWKLIEQYLILVDKNKFKGYINNAKDYTFFKIIKDYPEVVNENSDFYQNQIRGNLFFYKLIKRIIKRIF